MEPSTCERFQDEILRGETTSPALKEHLSQCNECQGFFRTYGALGLTSSAYPTDMFASLRGKILANSLPPVVAPEPASVTPSPAPLVPTLTVITAMIGLFVAAFLMLRSSGPGSSPVGIGSDDLLSSGSIQVATGTRTLRGEDGTVVVLTGPAAGNLAGRELTIFWGEGSIQVATGTGPFRMTARDGVAEMGSGKFSVQVTSTGTRLVVGSGILRATSRGHHAVEFGPGETFDWENDVKTAPGVPPASGPAIFIPGTEREGLASPTGRAP